MNEAPRNGIPAYDAFISYSRKDADFARILETSLEKFRPPKGFSPLRRRLSIFRDENDFTGVSYHESLVRHLRDSAALIVICSPDAAKSLYVDEEIKRFAEVEPRYRERIIPVLYRGVPNNEVPSDRREERAFPDALCDLLGMPLAVNYLHFQPQKDKPDRGAFASSWFSLLANLYRVSRAEIEERERRRRIRSLKIWIAAGATVASCLLIALIIAIISRHQAVLDRERAKAAAVALSQANDDLTQANREKEKQRAVAVQERELAVRERGIAEQRQKLAVSRLLAQEAADRSRIQPDQALLLAVEANLVARTPDARSSLFAVLQESSEIGAYLHTRNAVRTVAYSPDGTTLATAGEENQVQLWNLRTNRPKGVPFPLQSTIDTVAFSPDGKRLASGDKEGRVSICDLERHRSQTIYQEFPPSTIWQVAYRPDGKMLAAAATKELVVWDLTKETASQRSWPRHPQAVSGVAFSHDSSMLANSEANEVVVSEASSGKLLRRLACQREGPGLTEVSFSQDDRTLFASCGKKVVAWQLSPTVETGQTVASSTKSILGFSVSPDGKTLALGGADGVLTLWNTSQNKIARKPLSPGLGWLMTVAFNPDGKSLACGWGNRNAILVSTAATNHLSSFHAGHRSGGFSPRLGTLATWTDAESNLTDAKIAIWTSTPAWHVLREFPISNRLSAIAFSPTSQVLAAGFSSGSEEQGTVELLDPRTGKQIGKSMSSLSWVGALAFSPDGHSLAMAGGAPAFSNYGIRIWDYTANRLISEIPSQHKMPVTTLSFAGDDRTLVSKADSTLLWNIQTHTRIMPPWNPTDGVTWNRSGTVFAWASQKTRRLHVWDRTTGRSQTSSDAKNGSPMAVSRDGRVIALGASNELSFYDSTTLQPLGPPEPVAGGVGRIEFSPDGKFVATAGQSGGVAIWDLETRRSFWLYPPDKNLFAPPSIAFSPDAKTLLVSDESGLTLWDLDLSSWFQRACAIANRNLSLSESAEFLGYRPSHKTCDSLPPFEN